MNKAHEKNLPGQWRDRLEAGCWKAESLILLARLVAEMVEHACGSRSRPHRLTGQRPIVGAHILLDRIVKIISPSSAVFLQLLRCSLIHPRLHLTPDLFSPYSLVMNEYGFFTQEAGSYQERVHHIQLAYASYAAVLALCEIASLLGVEGLNFPQFTTGDLTAHNAVAPMPYKQN